MQTKNEKGILVKKGKIIAKIVYDYKQICARLFN